MAWVPQYTQTRPTSGHPGKALPGISKSQDLPDGQLGQTHWFLPTARQPAGTCERPSEGTLTDVCPSPTERVLGQRSYEDPDKEAPRVSHGWPGLPSTSAVWVHCKPPGGGSVWHVPSFVSQNPCNMDYVLQLMFFRDTQNGPPSARMAPGLCE